VVTVAAQNPIRAATNRRIAGACAGLCLHDPDQENNAGSTVVRSSRFNVKAGASEADAKKLISGVYRTGLDNPASVVR
jgi:hypothetical protein